jgi:hypothetical protein
VPLSTEDSSQSSSVLRGSDPAPEQVPVFWKAVILWHGRRGLCAGSDAAPGAGPCPSLGVFLPGPPARQICKPVRRPATAIRISRPAVQLPPFLRGDAGTASWISGLAAPVPALLGAAFPLLNSNTGLPLRPTKLAVPGSALPSRRPAIPGPGAPLGNGAQGEILPEAFAGTLMDRHSPAEEMLSARAGPVCLQENPSCSCGLSADFASR